MIDDERHPDAKIGPHRQTAALYDVFPAHDRPMKPAGEWNTSEVIVKGKHVTHILNGKTVLETLPRCESASSAPAGSPTPTCARRSRSTACGSSPSTAATRTRPRRW